MPVMDTLDRLGPACPVEFEDRQRPPDRGLRGTGLPGDFADVLISSSIESDEGLINVGFARNQSDSLAIARWRSHVVGGCMMEPCRILRIAKQEPGIHQLFPRTHHLLDFRESHRAREAGINVRKSEKSAWFPGSISSTLYLPTETHAGAAFESPKRSNVVRRHLTLWRQVDAENAEPGSKDPQERDENSFPRMGRQLLSKAVCGRAGSFR